MDDGRKKMLRIASRTNKKLTRKLRFIVLGYLCLLLASCSSPIETLNFDDFSELPSIKDINFKQVNPVQDFDYWELRQAETATETEILGSGGSKTKAQLSQAERTALDNVNPNTGFNIGCQQRDGSFCFKYIVTLTNGQLNVLKDINSVAKFLDEIDGLAEAVLLASAHGFTWDGTSVQTGGFKELGGEYDFIVLRLTNLCLPVQTDRFHIRITGDASVSIIASESWQTFANNCILQE